ncbi:MAG: prolipoprotein diacylglyceryl transferase [Balneolaceae bacterium]|nr:prolipoprotein diacylglyceryl transferase [Balneolaceae bacterium]
MEKLMEKLKARWGVESPWQVLLILFIFAITGFSALYVRKFFFTFFGIDAQTPMWSKILLWVLTVVPSYQVLFLTYGFLLGQFEFVWEFEKNSARRIKRLFSFSKQ